MAMILRVEYRPEPNMDDETIAVLAANNLVAVACSFPNMVFTVIQLVTSVLGYDMYAHPASTRESVLERWRQGMLNERATAYVCEYCLVSSLKHLWGPGRITCPGCGKMAKTADGTPRP